MTFNKKGVSLQNKLKYKQMEKTTKITRPAAQHSTAQHSTAQHSTAQHSTAQHSTAQHSTAQHSTAQHSTAQHSTAQHSTAHRCKGLLKKFWTLLLIPVLLLTIFHCETDQTEINNLNQRIDALTIANNNLRAQISTITGTTTTITGDTATIMNLQNQLNQLANTLSGANATNVTATATISGLQNQLSTLSGTNAEQIANFQNELNYLNKHQFLYSFDLPAASSDFLNEGGLHSDGETMWITNLQTHKIIAYTVATISGAKQRVPSKDIPLISGNNNPTGIWSDGTTMWVGDSVDNIIYAYRMANGDRDANKDITVNIGNRALWSDGVTMWAVFSSQNKIFAYNLDTKMRDESKDIDDILKNSPSSQYTGLYSDGKTMWVMEFFFNNMGESNTNTYAYNLSNKRREESKDFNTIFGVQYGLWSDGRIMWSYNGNNNTIEAYDMDTKARLLDYQPVNP